MEVGERLVARGLQIEPPLEVGEVPDVVFAGADHRSRRLRVQRVSQCEVVCLPAAPAGGLVAAPRRPDRSRRQQRDRQDLEDSLAVRARVPWFLQLLGYVLVHVFRHGR